MTMPLDPGSSGAGRSAERLPSGVSWRDAKAIIERARQVSAQERVALLDEACGADATLRRYVEMILAEMERMNGFLERPAVVDAALAGSYSPDGDDESVVLMARVANALADAYTIVRELGGGGMSRVYLAIEHSPRRDVVIKLLSPEVSAERFAREVQLAADLEPVNIVPVLETGMADGLPYYTMPYIRGESLRARLLVDPKPPLEEVLRVLSHVAEALAYAHAKGVVHRDIKPENVLLSSGRAFVTDFGIAKALSASRARAKGSNTFVTPEDITEVGVSPCTPAYMSPEQAAGEREVDPTTDVYSFGIMAYEMLAGAHPFESCRTRAALTKAHLLDDPVPLPSRRPDVPARLARVVGRSLRKVPAERFADGAELLAALVEAASDPTPEVPSIAVLPFESRSADPDYFSDGITDEVHTALTRLRGVHVAGQTSTRVFRGQQVDLRTIGERLGVRRLLEGSVRRQGSRVRIAVQLVSAIDGMTIWSEQYDRELSDFLAVQSEIASAIASALETQLAGSQLPRRSVHPEAFELYLRGRHLVEQREQGMLEGLGCFEQSIRIDPTFAPSHAGIGFAYAMFGIYLALRPREAFTRAREAAERALALDPTDAMALVVRATVALWFEWDPREAERLVRRALDLAPAFYLAHSCLGWVLAAQGRFDEAIAAAEEGRTLDPLSDNATFDLGWMLILGGHAQRAIELLDAAVHRHPLRSELWRTYAYALFHSGRNTEALPAFERVLELNPGDRWGPTNLAEGLAAVGDTAAALRLTQDVERRLPDEPLPVVGLAIVHHWLQDDDAAMDWLERSIEARDYWMVMLRHDPSMAQLRGDARFESLLARVRPDGATR